MNKIFLLFTRFFFFAEFFIILHPISETICIVNRRDYNMKFFDVLNFACLYILPLLVMTVGIKAEFSTWWLLILNTVIALKASSVAMSIKRNKNRIGYKWVLANSIVLFFWWPHYDHIYFKMQNYSRIYRKTQNYTRTNYKNHSY